MLLIVLKDNAKNNNPPPKDAIESKTNSLIFSTLLKIGEIKPKLNQAKAKLL